MYLISFSKFFANPGALINLIGISLLAYHVSCHECYICGVGDNSRNCSEFDLSVSFKETCPSGVSSCSTQMTAGNVIARSCGEVYSLTDCRVANQITYCYCAANLCNGDTKPPIPFSDDEDFSENGSGAQTTTDVPVDTTQITQTTFKPISSTSTSIHTKISFILHLLMLI